MRFPKTLAAALNFSRQVNAKEEGLPGLPEEDRLMGLAALRDPLITRLLTAYLEQEKDLGFHEERPEIRVRHVAVHDFIKRLLQGAANAPEKLTSLHSLVHQAREHPVNQQPINDTLTGIL